ncbi:MAG TPA: hypothetical protein VIS10_08210 [Anaerolineales bacterium]
MSLTLQRLNPNLPTTYWLIWLGSFAVPSLSLYLTNQRDISISQAALMVSLFGIASFTASLAGGELADRLSFHGGDKFHRDLAKDGVCRNSPGGEISRAFPEMRRIHSLQRSPHSIRCAAGECRCHVQSISTIR